MLRWYIINFIEHVKEDGVTTSIDIFRNIPIL